MRSPSSSPRAPRNLVVIPQRGLCLEFANTLAWRGSAPTESLHCMADLLAWIGSNNAAPRRIIDDLRESFESRPALATEVFTEAIEIRETSYRMLHSQASGLAVAREDLRRLNRVLSQAPPRAILDRADDGWGWRIDAPTTAAEILAPVLWSASDILVGPDSALVRECANQRCLWLFLDDSKNSTRRWCSMQACGNRAKAQRHYLRSKQN